MLRFVYCVQELQRDLPGRDGQTPQPHAQQRGHHVMQPHTPAHTTQVGDTPAHTT